MASQQTIYPTKGADVECRHCAVSGAMSQTTSQPTYGATVTPDASAGNRVLITATDGNAFTVAAPLNPTTDQRLVVTIKNTSGGALGTITWNSVFKKATWTSPATANSRSAEFWYNGTNWIELWQSAADVPN